MYDLIPCRYPCAVEYLIAVVSVNVKYPNENASLDILFIKTFKDKLAQFGRRIILDHLHIKVLCSFYHSFNINSFDMRSSPYTKETLINTFLPFFKMSSKTEIRTFFKTAKRTLRFNQRIPKHRLIINVEISAHSIYYILNLVLGKAVSLHADKAVERYSLECVRMPRKAVVVDVEFLDIAAAER